MRGMSSLVIACALACAGPVLAADTDADTLKAFIGKLHLQSGTVTVPEAHATLKLAPDFRYVGAHDAQNVLENLWGNPPDSDVLGMILPEGEKSLTEENTWAVVLTYSDDGYVSDEEASKTDYVKMLKEMQEGTRDSNEARKKAGYDAVDLIGWAAAPRYDQAANKLYWAKELKFGDNAEHTLNYDIRVLGRNGYLSMNAISGMAQLPKVEAGMKQVLTMTEFDPGNRYADFNKSTDKLAAYGIAALVGGTLAAKAGLFGKLLVILLAAKKFVLLGLVAVGAAVKGLFKKKSA
ncbi:MAG: DUF2167 domain-containing protein [Tahibacter sp.]